MDILENIENPRQLEKLYRNNKSVFKTEFNLIYPKLTDNKLADYWNERLNYKSSEINWGSKKDLSFVLIVSILAGFIAKFPSIFNINTEFFYTRNIGLIIFPALTTFFIWRKNLSLQKILFVGVSFLIALIFINLLPDNNKSNTLILSCIHLPFLLWTLLGYSYIGNYLSSHPYRLSFLRYNGDLIIMTGLLIIAGGILTAITIGLFSVIGFNIEKFYFENIVVFCLPAVPIVATYITQANPQLINKVSPVIAKIFSPIVLVMLVVYLIAIFNSGKDPYTNRDFLVLFNLLLAGVMAIILFAIAAKSKSEILTGNYILFVLSIVTIIVNGVALSAILFRISEWGITPNRLAVMGSNVLMLTNLLLVSSQLVKSISNKTGINNVENTISRFFPIYILWATIVTFIFPFLFHFK